MEGKTEDRHSSPDGPPGRRDDDAPHRKAAEGVRGASREAGRTDSGSLLAPGAHKDSRRGYRSPGHRFAYFGETGPEARNVGGHERASSAAASVSSHDESRVKSLESTPSPDLRPSDFGERRGPFGQAAASASLTFSPERRPVSVPVRKMNRGGCADSPARTRVWTQRGSSPRGPAGGDARSLSLRGRLLGARPRVDQLFDLNAHGLTEIVGVSDDGYETTTGASASASFLDRGAAMAGARGHTASLSFELSGGIEAAHKRDGSQPPSLCSSRVAVQAACGGPQAKAPHRPRGLARSSAVIGKDTVRPARATKEESSRESLPAVRSSDSSHHSRCSSRRSKSVSQEKKTVHYVYQKMQKEKTNGRAKIRPSAKKDNRMKGVDAIRIFCGTWNSEYQEFPEETMTPYEGAGGLVESSSALPARLPERVVEELLDDEDAWATADSIGDAADANARDKANRGGGAPPLVEIRAADSRGFDRPGDEGPMVERRRLLRASTLRLKAVKQGEQPLMDWLLPGYDVYVVTLQETISDSVFQAIMAYISEVNGHQYARMHAVEDKISGLGDGAWTQFKSTSIAAWAREDMLRPRGPVEFLTSKAIPLSFFNGSKGAVSLLMRIWDQFVCFLGCHMPATTTEDRIKSRTWVIERLCESYSGMPHTTLDGVFHHVVWMGDFNFRTRNITAAKAVELLDAGKQTELLEYDECQGPQGEDMRKAGFVEGTVRFPPTYKKVDGRPPVDFSDPHWAEKEYQTKFTVKWYKGGHQEDRIPSWTDRVFKWSIPEMAYLLQLQKERYFAAMPTRANSFLNASDHSPVGSGFDMYPLDFSYALPSVVNIANPDTKRAG
ncbi:endonuclease/exonuclease/phosphatase family protein [Besnoitia besnoiti]|uniref:Endonuclease/exonuclease/phosphatase family protein n=1 Tax=Besnoitia besnoiti TaxID=94643 RepID=A0A2A9M2G4_BESBE|nr:endonuclease/exonuclease/phosphatase family protein [Besnoitia besnoiti]PFH32175.1 endonuclease/exonuclease/phosphatase family protein [Besnoitia besnoiti]